MGNDARLDSLSPTHFLGIGGVGMSGLARLLHGKGSRVTGSDEVESTTTAQLRALGIPIEIGPGSKALRAASRVIVSSMFGPNHPELRAARRLGIPIEKRSCALNEYVRGRDVVAVAGTHGKTTTTAMIATILRDAQMDPGFFVGGFARALGGVNARDASGALFVTEACEAFGVLGDWFPTHCVVTNVDDDHAEDYGGEAFLREAFGMLRWGAERDIKLHFIAPGKPTQNANIESLNGKIRHELFNMHRFMTIFEARRKAADWQLDYNHVRPHSALGYRTSREFAEEFKINQLSQLSAA